MREIGTDTWFSSDWHLGHANIVRYTRRWQWYEANGYPGAQDWISDKDVRVPIEEIDELIVERWNSRVGPDDEAFVVGDIALTNLEDSLRLIGRLNGRKTMVVGNHDRCFSYSTRFTRHPERLEPARDRYREAGFVDVVDSAEVLMGGERFDVNHFPFVGESVSGIRDRYPEARPQPRGRPLICGHVHEAWKAQAYGDSMMVNVGCDAWGGYPIRGETILRLAAAGQDDYGCDSWV